MLGAQLDLAVARRQVRRDEEEAGVQHLLLMVFKSWLLLFGCKLGGERAIALVLFGVRTVSVTPMPPLLPSCFARAHTHTMDDG